MPFPFYGLALQPADCQKYLCKVYRMLLRIRLVKPRLCLRKVVAGCDPIGQDYDPKQQGAHTAPIFFLQLWQIHRLRMQEPAPHPVL